MNHAQDPSDEPSDDDRLDDEEHLEEMSHSTGRPASRFKAGPFVVVALLVTIFALIQVQRKIMNRPNSGEGQQSSQSDADQTVGLTVQWDSETRLPLYETPWRPGITVRDLMLAAQKAGTIDFVEEGEGEAAMLTAISGTENQGGGTDSFNWTFEVNGTLADRSFGVYELQEGDIVLWKFGPYE